MLIFLWSIIDHLQQIVDARRSKRGHGSLEKKIKKKVLF
jgi:hypothetical protein